VSDGAFGVIAFELTLDPLNSDLNVQ